MKEYEYGENAAHFCCECLSTSYRIEDLRIDRSGNALCRFVCSGCGKSWDSLQQMADDDVLLTLENFYEFLGWPPTVPGMEVMTLPCWSIPYLLYGDASGLEEDEIAMADEFAKEWRLRSSVHSWVAGTYGFVDPPEEEAGFYTNPDIGNKAGYCEEWYCELRNKQESNEQQGTV